MDESKETPIDAIVNESVDETDGEAFKKTILPPAGLEEMAKSAGTNIRNLNMSWTKGRHQVRFKGVCEDTSTPGKFRKGPRSKRV